MPIREAQPETDDLPRAHPVEVGRPGGIEGGMHELSPGVLLSPGAPTLQAPVPAPARALALDALLLIRLLRDPARRPKRWQQPAFGAEVESIGRHLAPVRSRQTLAASYGREAFRLAPTRADRTDPSPVRLAYALRWLELRDGSTDPPWTSLLD
jgi:hypothetical protein